MDTVTLTIDGRQVTVEKGKTVLQAAIEAGITVPYYCYHPGIGIDGSCRVCIVKIEKMPKLQTSCSTVCTDGMIVLTRTQEVADARAGVFEFLLINHPLDCPVCDKGGECPLQDFSYTFGRDQSRMEFPRREFDGDGVKADVDFGPTLMLNRNRCILCTLCEKGCNVNAWIKAKPEWAKGSRLVRFTPRFNPTVNGFWMCDIGRFEYHWIEGDKRLRKPLERTDAGAFEPVTWRDLLSKLGDRLAAAGRSRSDGVQFLLSAHASHEELFLFRRLAEELIGDVSAVHVNWRYREKAQPASATFVVPPVEAPNVNGARIFGLVPGAVGERVGDADTAPLRRALQDE